ncbi:MAG: hypothetical protein LBP74_06010, partial [Treponema sp.]|nr:hypothetical protein [Treponema sp.]
GKQYLFPVSFNLPVLIFSSAIFTGDGEPLSSPLIIGFDEIKARGKNYNLEKNGVYTRMGFSPSWNDQFLFTAASIFGASFREDSPAAWDAAALKSAMRYLDDWIRETNTGISAEEDFAFKYFFEPQAQLVISGRILFAFMDSASFFTLAEERRSLLDFRWISQNGVIPLVEDTVYYGICKKGRAKKAANAFTRWFFQAGTQQDFLEKNRNDRLIETSFGIAGGFSALRTVTEQVFPRFYPGLMNHMPPEDHLLPPNILPGNWIALKEQVILPYLRERVRRGENETRPLERRISDWSRLNRE